MPNHGFPSENEQPQRFTLVSGRFAESSCFAFVSNHCGELVRVWQRSLPRQDTEPAVRDLSFVQGEAHRPVFRCFLSFPEELGATAATQTRQAALRKSSHHPEKNKNRTQTRLPLLPRVSVLLRCTVTGCSWLPDLVCCSKTAFSAKQSRFAQQSTANPGPAARYGALGTPRPLASGLIKSRVAS